VFAGCSAAARAALARAPRMIYALIGSDQQDVLPAFDGAGAMVRSPGVQSSRPSLAGGAGNRSKYQVIIAGPYTAASAASAAAATGNARRRLELGGAVFCPVPGCAALAAAAASPDAAAAAAFSSREIAIHVDEATFAAYTNGMTLLPIAMESARIHRENPQLRGMQGGACRPHRLRGLERPPPPALQLMR